MFSTLYCSLVSNSSLAYQTGPTVYCSRTVFEDATPELVRDFFWDDEFRPKWDPMLAYCNILEECRDTGTMIVHWIKKVCGTWESTCTLCFCLIAFLLKHVFDFSLYSAMQFPFFCSDREYIIGRRIWEAGKTYYCVTKVLFWSTSAFIASFLNWLLYLSGRVDCAILLW